MTETVTDFRAASAGQSASHFSPERNPPPTSTITGDFWGGLAAMLVALPAGIAFGVTIYAPLGADGAAQGAIAGILGTITLGIVAAAFGGTRRLITAPSAPTVAVLAAFVIEMGRDGIGAGAVLPMLGLTAALCGLLEIGFGIAGFGRMIKYMPYPVVSGFQSGVGVIIVVAEVPKFLGTPEGTRFWHALLSPSLWKWQSIAVGAVTIAVMTVAPKLTRKVPAAVIGLLVGVAAYFALAVADRSLLGLSGNRLVIGPLPAAAGFFGGMLGRWRAFAGFDLREIKLVLEPAATLAVLLSIDTLKTSVVLDRLTRSRHASNRELIGQGLGNIASMAVGGLPGSGQTGATLVNMSSGGETRWSGVIEGALALLAFVLLAREMAWIPIAAVAGILIVVGMRMFDRQSLGLLKSRSTALDFAVVLVVVVIAVTVSLIAASAAGIALAILLFLREQSRDLVVRRKSYGNERFSRQMRNRQEMTVLQEHGDRTAIFELQGSLFFGTADQLYLALQPEFQRCRYLVLDMRRVQSVDSTAAHMLELIEDIMSDRNGMVIFSHMPRRAPSGQDMIAYFKQVGLAQRERHSRVFPHLEAALEWVEDRILEEAHVERPVEEPWDLSELEVLRERKRETIAALEASTVTRRCHAGEAVFRTGEPGNELYFIRKGSVRILMPLAGRAAHHLSTFGRGDVFGEISFIDNAPRSADAVAETELEIYVLTRERFDALMKEHDKLGLNLLDWIARIMATRLRRTDMEVRYLKES